MKLPPSSHIFQLFALFALAVSLMFVSVTDTTHAHGVGVINHDLVMSGAFSHWDDGSMDYRFHGAFPTGWTSQIHNAATHMENSTFALGIDENNSSSSLVYIGGWPWLLGFMNSNFEWPTCKYSGRLGGTKVCAYPASGSISGVGLDITANITDHLNRVNIVFDEIDVYEGTTTGQ